MNARSAYLLARARDYVDGLARHEALGRYWPVTTAVVKGSTARGNADRYSDIDLVLFCDERIRRRIVLEFHRRGLIPRQDGLFILFQERDYDGHYHVESFQQLDGYFAGRDFVHLWDYAGAVPLHDPGERYQSRIAQGMQTLFADPLAHVKRAYLDLQLDLDWMRHPLKRGDSVSAYLHAARIVRGVCLAAYLLDARPYPPDKWLVHYLGGTRFGKQHRAAIMNYARRGAGIESIPRHLSLPEYPLYAEAADLIGELARAVKRYYEDAPWLDRWWEYV